MLQCMADRYADVFLAAGPWDAEKLWGVTTTFIADSGCQIPDRYRDLVAFMAQGAATRLEPKQQPALLQQQSIDRECSQNQPALKRVERTEQH